MSWRDRAAQILEKGAGVELNKPNKPPAGSGEEVISVFSVPPTGLFDLDPESLERRGRVSAALEARSELTYVGHTQEADGVLILTIGIRGKGTVEMHIPAEKWDGTLFIEMMNKRNFH